MIIEGPKGGGKTYVALMDFAQHVGKGFGGHWRGILFRRTFPELSDVIDKSRRWFTRAFPGARYNESAHTWRWPDGEELLFRFMHRMQDYWSYHGHEYPWIWWEELGTHPNPDYIDAMRSCSRSSHPGMPRRYGGSANPYGPGHNWIKMRWIDPAPRNTPFRDRDGTLRVAIHSHWRENKKLLAAEPDYAAKLGADRNVNRRKAWLHGDWDIVAGGMFDDVWSRERHVLKPFPIPSSWRIDRAFDWGSSRPFSVGWWAESDGTVPEGVRPIPRGSLVRIGEWYGWDGENPNEGIKMPDVDIAKGIVKRETDLGIRGRVKAGPADSSIFVAEPGKKSIADAMESTGAAFTPANKKPGSRKSGWEVMRRMLSEAAKERPEGPGLYVFETCSQFIRTVPTLPRRESDPDDVDTEAEDHVGDEVRYRISSEKRVVTNFEWRV